MCFFAEQRLSRFLSKRKKMNKQTKKNNYVKRENVVIATYLPPKWYGRKEANTTERREKIINCNRKYDKILDALTEAKNHYIQANAQKCNA